MRHSDKVWNAIRNATRRRLRHGLGLRARSHPPPILSQSVEKIVCRHAGIVRTLREKLPSQLALRGASVCEVGCGDCLAAAGFYLAGGAGRVDLVEIAPPVVNQKQRDVLEALRAEGLPVDPGILLPGADGWRLDAARVRHHACFMEEFRADQCYTLLSSFSVVEHVEDLAGFHAACHRALQPGGWALHIVDLGGHEQFEDPLPPLEFQTYPDWLYWLMYPRYARATRRFLDEHVEAARGAGFRVESVEPLRRAEADYLAAVHPHLRRAARQRPPEVVGVIEFALLLRKP